MHSVAHNNGNVKTDHKKPRPRSSSRGDDPRDDPTSSRANSSHNATNLSSETEAECRRYGLRLLTLGEVEAFDPELAKIVKVGGGSVFVGGGRRHG